MRIIKSATIKGSRVRVMWSDRWNTLLFDFTPNPVPFTAKELIGLTFDQAVALKNERTNTNNDENNT